MPRNPRIALLGAVAGVALLAAEWTLAFHVGFVRHADAATLNGFTDLGRPRVDAVASFFAHLADPKPFVVLAVVLVAIALRRHRPRVAAAVLLILAGANVTTQILKPLLAQSRLSVLVGHSQVQAVSWPSGHATASMSLALCAVLVAPGRWRGRVAALGAVFAVVVCYSFLTLGWHLPSDVFAGFLVAATWTCLAVAAVWATEARWPAGSARGTGATSSDAFAPALAAAGLALALGVLVALMRPEAVLAYARAHTLFVVGAGVIGLIGLALSSGLAAVLRRPVDAGAGGTSGSGPAPTAAPRRGLTRERG